MSPNMVRRVIELLSSLFYILLMVFMIGIAVGVVIKTFSFIGVFFVMLAIVYLVIRNTPEEHQGKWRETIQYLITDIKEGYNEIPEKARIPTIGFILLTGFFFVCGILIGFAVNWRAT